MGKTIQLGEISADVIQKDIKNIHLSVYPPTGAVRISAPLRMDLETIRVFALTKLGWIRKQRNILQGQERETAREYLDRESHYLWGKRHLLKIVESNSTPLVRVEHSDLVLQVRPGADLMRRHSTMDRWYRQQLREASSPLIAHWERQLDVSVTKLIIRKMKTRWGSCTPASQTIRLNLELVKKPPECLEYIIVHELAHMIEHTHNSRFVGLMNQFLKKWQFYREELNRLPVKHEEWTY